ncbi:megakaryocyte and platelet inhibitory receptor G6b [Rhynchocyon petersi]
MALVLQLLLLSGTRGDPGASLEGRLGDRVNLSCVGVSHPIRWAWAPSFPACKGLNKGRRPILWASPSGTPTGLPAQPFVGRLRALEPGIRRLELLLSAGDSGTFFCRGRQDEESHTVLHVLEDRADCMGPGSPRGSMYPQLLIPLVSAGIALGLGTLGVAWWLRSFHHRPVLTDPLMKAQSQWPVMEEESKFPEYSDPEPSLFYADLDHSAMRSPCHLFPEVTGDTATIYAVVV